MNIDKFDDMDDHNDDNNNEKEVHRMVSLIDVQPHKGQTVVLPEIDFTHNDTPRHAPDGPLYIIGCINEKPVQGILIDPMCVENVIIEEFLFVHEL